MGTTECRSSLFESLPAVGREERVTGVGNEDGRRVRRGGTVQGHISWAGEVGGRRASLESGGGASGHELRITGQAGAN